MSRRSPWVLLLALLFAAPATALESDPYYGFDRDLADVTDLLNAKAYLEIEKVLTAVNARPSWESTSCHQLVKKIAPRFRQFIFHEFELWVTNSPLVDRIPRTPEEELQFLERYLYRQTHFLDLGTKVPPSPTLLVNGVRIGSDKLSHFFSEGFWYYRWYRGGRKKGLSHEQAEQRAIRKGIFGERTILGKLASGVFSVGDLEANYQGMHFFVGLCDGERPGLTRTDDGWQQSRTLDFRDYVTPEWDESYLPPVYGRSRWRKVRPVLLEYCPLLEDDRFMSRRRDYAARDRVTLTEQRIERLIGSGKLRDPMDFGLDRNCPEPAAAQPPNDTARSGSSR